MNADLEQRVAAGAALLDRERPGWWEEVDTDDLDMASDCDCVLGQPWGWYGNGLRALNDGPRNTRHNWALAHGFELGQESYPWAELDHLWLAAIAERRARAESVGPTAEEWAAQR